MPDAVHWTDLLSDYFVILSTANIRIIFVTPSLFTDFFRFPAYKRQKLGSIRVHTPFSGLRCEK